MIEQAIQALQGGGYDTAILQLLIRADLPAGYRGSTWGMDGASLSPSAFSSQAMLNHVLEEELLHLFQKAGRAEQSYGRGTTEALEEEVNAQRRFPLPDA